MKRTVITMSIFVAAFMFTAFSYPVPECSEVEGGSHYRMTWECWNPSTTTTTEPVTTTTEATTTTTEAPPSTTSSTTTTSVAPSTTSTTTSTSTTSTTVVEQPDLQIVSIGDNLVLERSPESLVGHGLSVTG